MWSEDCLTVDLASDVEFKKPESLVCQASNGCEKLHARSLGNSLCVFKKEPTWACPVVSQFNDEMYRYYPFTGFNAIIKEDKKYKIKITIEEVKQFFDSIEKG